MKFDFSQRNCVVSLIYVMFVNETTHEELLLLVIIVEAENLINQIKENQAL